MAPLSLAGMISDTVPSVCPGVKYIVTVVSPSVSFCPSVITMSFFAIGGGGPPPRGGCATIVQSASDIRTFAP